MANQVARRSRYSVKQLISDDTVKAKFENVLGKKAPQFTTSLINVVNSNSQLEKADANSVIASALVAASLDLPVNPSLGYMYIIPYKDTAQPQIGYKGYIQLAQRSGQYKRINALPVYEDEYGGWDPLSEKLVYEAHYKDRGEEKPVGYYGSFELLNGFEKNVYWTYQQIDDHRKRFSKAGGKGGAPRGVWKDNFDAMALKTVLRNLLTKWGPMTVDVQSADLVDSGEYDHDPLKEERREVQAEESEPSADEIISQALGDVQTPKQQSQVKEQKKENKPVESGDGNAQEELFQEGTITPDVK